jgi:hypothetical protein
MPYYWVMEPSIIVFKIDEEGLNECLRLMSMAVGEEAKITTSADERFGDLLRLDRIIRNRYQFVPFHHDGDWLPTGDTWSTRILPAPTNALRNHLAAMGTAPIDGTVKEVAHIG